MPFCVSKCAYCSFVSGSFPVDVIENYCAEIVDEIRAYFEKSNCDYEVSTFYIGGGTPSSISSPLLKKTLCSILEIFKSQPVEVSIEVNPSDVTKELTDALTDAGVNRVSLGVQSFDDDVLTFLGRRQNNAQNIKSFKILREAGFDNLSIDLIYGIPGYGIDRWKSDLIRAVELNPEHISLYALSLDEGTPLFDAGYADALNPDDTADEYYEAVGFLKDSGYERYEISNFSKPSKECRHNLTYWMLGDYVGFGPEAGSYLDGQYFERINNVLEYIECLKNKESTIRKRESFDIENQFLNAMIMGLRLEKGIELDRFIESYGINPENVARKFWGDFIDGEHVILDENCLKFGNKGFFVSNTLLSMLM